MIPMTNPLAGLQMPDMVNVYFEGGPSPYAGSVRSLNFPLSLEFTIPLGGVLAFGAVWQPEGVPMFRLDARGREYTYCPDGKYRRVEFGRAVYRLDGVGTPPAPHASLPLYRYVGGEEPRQVEWEEVAPPL